MSEEDKDKAFRGPGAICAPVVPAPMLATLYMQHQLLQSGQETVRMLMRMNPFLRLFMQ